MANDTLAFSRVTAASNTAAKVLSADSGPRTRVARNVSGADIYLGSTSSVDNTGWLVKDGEIFGDGMGHSAVFAICPTAALDVRIITVQ
jgi:hypothetical protein